MEDKYSLDRSSPGPSESFRRALGSGRRQTEPRVCPEWGPGRFLGYDQEQSRAESETMSLVLAGSTDRLHVQPIQRFPIKIVFIVFTRNKDLRINKYLTYQLELRCPSGEPVGHHRAPVLPPGEALTAAVFAFSEPGTVRVSRWSGLGLQIPTPGPAISTSGSQP